MRMTDTTATPKPMRPHFPPGYVENPKRFLPWSHVEQRLTESKNYWLCTVRPNGHPHSIAKWAVWVQGKVYFDGSPETRHMRNIAQNPHVSLHLESGDDVLIMEGLSQAVMQPPRALTTAIAEAYAAKYKSFGYAPTPDQWDAGGLYEITPHSVIAWTSFTEDPTKWILE